MDANGLDVLTALLSLVSAIGVLVVGSKVDRLTGRVAALDATLHLVVTAILGRKSSDESQNQPITDAGRRAR